MKNKRDYSNIILIALFIFALVAISSEKSGDNAIEEVENRPIFEEDMTEMTMPERLIIVEEFVKVAIEDSGYAIEDVDVEYYPEHQDDEAVTLELFIEKDRIFLGYRIDPDTMEVIEVGRGDFIPYTAPTEYGEGYLTPEECLEIALAYAGFEYDEVDCLEIGDNSEGDKSYRVTWTVGDYWYHIIQDALDGRIRDVDTQLIE